MTDAEVARAYYEAATEAWAWYFENGRPEVDDVLASDDPRVRRYLELVDEDVVCYAVFAEGIEIHGRREMLRTYFQAMEVAAEYEIRVVDARPGPERVFVEIEAHGSTSATGISLGKASIYAAVTVRDEKVVEFREFVREDLALAAAGIPAGG